MPKTLGENNKFFPLRPSKIVIVGADDVEECGSYCEILVNLKGGSSVFLSMAARIESGQTELLNNFNEFRV